MKYKVVFPYNSAEIGGSHLSSMTIIEELYNQDAQSCVVVCAAEGQVREEVERRGLPFRSNGESHRPNWNSITYDLAKTLRRTRILQELRGDRRLIVHCNDMPTLQSWLIPAKLSGAKMVYHHRSINGATLKKKTLLLCTDRIIALSDHTKRNVSYLPASKVIKLINAYSFNFGFDFKIEQAKLKAELGIKETDSVFAYIGNFWDRKRPKFFIDVARALCSQRDDCYFVFYGRSGDIDESELKNYVKSLDLESRVFFLGFRMPPEKNIAAVDALLITALNEPFGRTVVEAAIAGKPYFATDSGGNAEGWALLGGGELVSEDATPQQFADVVVRWLVGGTEIHLNEDARAAAKESLSAASYLERLHRVYESLFERQPSFQ